MTTLSTGVRTTSLADLTDRQLSAIDAFNRARRLAEQAAAAQAASREMRMDSARRIEILRREHQAVVERAEAAIRSSGALLHRRRAPTAVIAHRQPWFTGKVTARLEANGVRVLGSTDVGPDAVGWVIAEQPELVLVDDTLGMLSGEQTVRDVRQYCPSAVIGAQVPYSDRVGALLDAGATCVHVRSVPPAQVVDELLALLPA